MRCSSVRSGLSSCVVSSCRCESGGGVDESELATEVAVELPQRSLEMRQPAGAGHAGTDRALHRGADVEILAVDVANQLDQLAAAFLDIGRGQRGRRHADVELKLDLARAE